MKISYKFASYLICTGPMCFDSLILDHEWGGGDIHANLLLLPLDAYIKKYFMIFFFFIKLTAVCVSLIHKKKQLFTIVALHINHSAEV